MTLSLCWKAARCGRRRYPSLADPSKPHLVHLPGEFLAREARALLQYFVDQCVPEAAWQVRVLRIDVRYHLRKAAQPDAAIRRSDLDSRV